MSAASQKLFALEKEISAIANDAHALARHLGDIERFTIEARRDVAALQIRAAQVHAECINARQTLVMP